MMANRHFDSNLDELITDTDGDHGPRGEPTAATFLSQYSLHVQPGLHSSQCMEPSAVTTEASFHSRWRPWQESRWVKMQRTTEHGVLNPNP